MHEVTMKKLYALLLAAVLLASIATTHFYRTFDPHVHIHKWPYKKKMAFTVSCDDVSAGYPHHYLDEIEDTLDKYGVRATFFVIPYHGQWDLLTDYPSFVDALHKAEEKGHEIALHGYAHYEDEFVCSPEEQIQALESALSIMEEAGFTVKGFRAPCFKATSQTAGILKEYNFVYDSSTFGESGDVSLEGVLPEIPSGYEYSWYITGEELPKMLDQAKMDFETQYSQESIFSLVTHMKAVNEGEGIPFLEDFLLYVIEKEVWNFTLEELVEWTLKFQEVTWESKKTITGGEITFEHIPQGLSAEIDLPLHYRLKDIPQGVEVITKRENETQKVELVFHHYFEEVTVSFVLSYENQVNNEVLILRNPSDLNSDLNSIADLNSLTKSLNSWEINYRIADTDYITSDLLAHSFTILIDRNFLKQSLSLKENLVLSSLKNRVIIFSGFNLGFPLDIIPTTDKKLMDYTSFPLEIPISKYKGFYDLLFLVQS
jgi:predicted deacetylase